MEGNLRKIGDCIWFTEETEGMNRVRREAVYFEEMALHGRRWGHALHPGANVIGPPVRVSLNLPSADDPCALSQEPLILLILSAGHRSAKGSITMVLSWGNNSVIPGRRMPSRCPVCPEIDRLGKETELPSKAVAL
jgi:hypothetical protein